MTVVRVLHVIPSVSSAHGGPTTALELTERALSSLGVEVETATTDDDGPGKRKQLALGTPLKQNGVKRRYFAKRLEFYKVAPSFAVWIARHARDYDVIHIHALFSFTSIVAAWAARRAGVPYVLRPLGTLSRYGLEQRRPLLKRWSMVWLEGPALRHAAAVQFTSEDEEREARLASVACHAAVIPLGVEPWVAADANAITQRFPALSGKPYLLYLARLDTKKNVEGLLEAFGLCVATWPPDVNLLIAGSGDPAYERELQALAARHRLAGRVVWAGHLAGALKQSALAGASLFVLPSYSENFGMAAAEALMAGLPCVLGQGVALAHDVAQAGAGVSVGTDAKSIAAGLDAIMSDPDARTRMSARARELARQQYSTALMGKRLVSLYSRITAKRQDAAA